MSKNSKYAQKSAHAIPVHYSESIAVAEPARDGETGHVVYPEIVRQHSRLETISRTIRNFVPSFSPSSAGNPVSQTPPSTRNIYGSYASTASADVPEESDSNSIVWSDWATFHNHALLLVAYRMHGFHIWDVSSLDAIEERLYLPALGPVIAACLIPDIKVFPSKLLLLVGNGKDTSLNIYSLDSHSTIARHSIPHARTIQANATFICVGVEAAPDTRLTYANVSRDGPSAIHVFTTASDYSLLYSIPSSSLSAPLIFALSSSRCLAYASPQPPVHRKQHNPPTSYPPSNVPAATLPLTSGLATGAAVIGSGVLSGARILGSGLVEGMKMGMTAAGYRSASSNGGELTPERDKLFSRSAPTSNVSPLSSRGHSRRASGNVNSRNTGSPSGASQAITGAHEGGNWVTILDLQPLLQPPTSERGDHDHNDRSPIPRSSSFHSNLPTLSTLSSPTATYPPFTLAEFQYSALSSSILSTFRPLGRASPGDSTSLSMTPVSKSTPTGAETITSMRWTSDGSMIAVGGSSGGSAKVFKVLRRSRRRGHPAASSGDEGKGGMDKGMIVGEVSLVSELVRGVSSASVDGFRWSEDGLWSALLSSNGTLHFFAVDRNGGTPDERSHIGGKVCNAMSRVPGETPVRLSSIARLRQPFLPLDEDSASASRAQSASRNTSNVNLPAFDEQPTTLDALTSRSIPSITFIPNAHSLSAKRIPAPRNSSSRPLTPSDSDVHENCAGSGKEGFQDILVFNPDDAMLILWRCSIRSSSSHILQPSQHPSLERSTSIAGEAATQLPAESGLKGSAVPVDGMLGSVGRMAEWARGTDVMETLTGPSSGLLGEGAVIANWRLGRGDGWAEVRASFALNPDSHRVPSKASSLSFAEITTFPTRSHLAKRPLYLSRQFAFCALTIDYHALLRRSDLDPPSVPITVRKESVIVRSGDYDRTVESIPNDFDSNADFLGTNTGPLDLADSPLLGGQLGLMPDTGHFSSSLASTSATSFSSPSRGGRKATLHSFDESLSSAMESNLQLDSSYSPTGSSSDIASPGRVMPMLPNGRPGSVGSGVGIAGGLEAVVRGTTRVGKEVWGGIASARSPRLLPTKRPNSTPDMPKFDEEEEMFIVDGLDIAEGLTNTLNPPNQTKREASEATIKPVAWNTESSGIYPRMTDSSTTILGSSTSRGTEDGTWVAQNEVYAQAVEDDIKFEDVTGILDEEREERMRIQARMGVKEGEIIKAKRGKKVSAGKRKKKLVS